MSYKDAYMPKTSSYSTTSISGNVQTTCAYATSDVPLAMLGTQNSESCAVSYLPHKVLSAHEAKCYWQNYPNAKQAILD